MTNTPENNQPGQPPVPPQQPQQPQQPLQQPAYQQQGQPAQAANPLSTVTLNYWLSVFFIWLPALIFFMMEKDKPGQDLANNYHRENLNFSLIRTGWFLAGWILAFIPVLGWTLSVIGHLVFFVLHLIAAVKATDAYNKGQKAPFTFNFDLIK